MCIELTSLMSPGETCCKVPMLSLVQIGRTGAHDVKDSLDEHSRSRGNGVVGTFT